MKKRAILILAFLAIVLLSGCTTTFDLQLNGKRKTDVFGHSRKIAISGGQPSGGTYSGPGVRNGYFIPSEAGNGIHEITYSKWFHSKSTATIRVYGAPVAAKPCPQCKGTKEVSCPDCKGKGKINGSACEKCDGKGRIQCSSCNGETKIITGQALLDIFRVFSFSRLKLERKEHLLELSRIKYDEQEHLNPRMSFYGLDEDGNIQDILGGSELPPSKQKLNKSDSTAPIAFTFTIKLSLLEDCKIRVIKVKLTYGNYNFELYYDLRDVLEDDGDLQKAFVYPRAVCFKDEYYRLPYGLSVFDIKNEPEKNPGKKAWRDVEEYRNWIYQENAKKGYVRIVDNRDFIVFYSEESAMRSKNDEVWKFVKERLANSEDAYWKKVAESKNESLNNVLK